MKAQRRHPRNHPDSYVWPVTVQLSKRTLRQLKRVARTLSMPVGAFARECIEAGVTIPS